MFKTNKKVIKDKKWTKPNLLIYAHYYYPDVASTGQILKELAEGLLDSFHVYVICVVPSYDGTIMEEYKKKKYHFHLINGVNIVRVGVPSFNKTKKISRVKNILAYFFRAMLATFKVPKMDYVFGISQPPILGGLLGVWGKWVNKAKYIYNIQDFNPEQTMAIGYSKNRLVLKLMMNLDKFSCRQADKLIIVGRDMVSTLKNRFAEKNMPCYAVINNWIDEEEICPLPLTNPYVAAFRREFGLDNKFVFMYSGNLGLYYDLENLMKVIKQFPEGTKSLDGRKVIFAFTGDGSIRDRLYLYKDKHHMDNVMFIPYQDKENLNYSLNSADVHWCINAKGIKGVSVPSKIYGILAVGKPVIGVLEEGAEARMILEEIQCKQICNPTEYSKIKEYIQWFITYADEKTLVSIGAPGRKAVEYSYTKSASVKEYIRELLSC